MTSDCRDCPMGRSINEDNCYSCDILRDDKILTSAPWYPCPQCGEELDAFLEYEFYEGPMVVYRCAECDRLFKKEDLSERYRSEDLNEDHTNERLIIDRLGV